MAKEMVACVIGDNAPEFRSGNDSGTHQVPRSFQATVSSLFSHSGCFHAGLHHGIHDLRPPGDEFKAINTELLGSVPRLGLQPHSLAAHDQEKIEFKA
jgi:hypothetical protein